MDTRLGLAKTVIDSLIEWWMDTPLTDHELRLLNSVRDDNFGVTCSSHGGLWVLFIFRQSELTIEENDDMRGEFRYDDPAFKWNVATKLRAGGLPVPEGWEGDY